MRAKDAFVIASAMVSCLAFVGCGDNGGAQGDVPDAGPTVTNDGGVEASVPANDAGHASSDGGVHDDDSGSSSGDDAAVDASSDDGGTDGGVFVPAPHPPFPKLVKGSGDVLTNPKVVGVFFSDYDLTDKVSAMLEGLPSVKTKGGLEYWSSAVAEYGVGKLTVLPPIKVAEKGPTSPFTDPATWLSTKLSSDPAFAAVDSNTIVAIFYPSTTPLIGSCAAGGKGYGGFHESVSTVKGNIPYAVMAECATFGHIDNALDMVTIAGSHEIIEAVTDPIPTGAYAYETIDANGWPMHVLLQGNEENGDMCTINDGFVRPPSPYGFLLQRGWSNHAAEAGNLDPCAPDVRPDQPFVGAFPVMPDTVSVQGTSGLGVKIPLQSSKTLEIDCFSFEPTAPFTVTVRQPQAPNPPSLTFALDKSTCVNGDKLHLTVTVNAAGANGYNAFLVQAHVPNAEDAQAPGWAGIVTQ